MHNSMICKAKKLGNSCEKAAKVAVFVAAMVGFAGTSAHAASAFTPTDKVNRLLVMEDSFGQCMAHLQGDPRSVLPGCGYNWVSFDCAGDFHSAAFGEIMFQQVQMAYALNKEIRVQVTDEQMHNGYCVAKRVDLR